MKNQLQSRKPNFKRKDHQREHATITVEQSASTAIASDRVWIWLSLVVVIAGLYWLSDRQENQAAWSYESLANASPAAESPANAEVDDQTKPLPEDLSSSGMSTGNQNEQLVRRYYDEVLNQRQFEVMDDLFAEDFTYQGNGVTSQQENLAALKQQLRDESFNYTELTYTIETVLFKEDWVIVSWLAAGRPFNAPLTEAPQRWSGRTDWQIVAGKIVWMLVSDAGSEPNGSDEDNFWQSDPFQNNQRVIE